MGFETSALLLTLQHISHFEAVPMGFETLGYLCLDFGIPILKQSLWDLKQLLKNTGVICPVYFEAVPMGFETYA